MSQKRVGCFGDPHCGHRAGLTPPDWWSALTRTRLGKWGRIQRECWNWFAHEVKVIKPLHLAVWNGDLIDGTGHRSGGTELIVQDRYEQCEMAERMVQEVGAKYNLFIRGTPFHVGEEEDWEDFIAQKFGEKCHDHEWPEINGVVFDVKHHVGGSQIPHGRDTATLKDSLWSLIWDDAGYQPKADIIVRSHVHYHRGMMWMSGAKQKWAFILPALQGMGSKFGARRMSGLVDFGFMHFDVGEKGDFSWQSHIGFIQSQRAQARKY